MARRVALGLTLLFALIAARGADLPARTFHIDPQPLASALRLFAEQAQVQLIFSEQDVRGLTSGAVDGHLPPRAALEALLRSTALDFELTPNHVAVVRKARPLTTAPEPPRRAAGNEQSTAPRDAHADDAERTALEAVTVTGSRIVRRDLEAASPIVTVDAQAFEESSTLAVESVLNQLPQFVPASTQFLTNDVFPTATNTPGISTLNLRGLATNRTLVLIDGRRVQPANSTLVIDVNSIPAAAISRVEIITGGASATYGADALSGVVNFKLHDNFEGATLEAHSGITEVGDGAERRLSALLGSNLDDGRGNVMLGLEWTRRSAASFLGRRFFENGWTDSGAPATSVRIDYSAYEPNASAGGLPSQAAA
ncbi:MAG TPA: TonB-dependent receptor, partial [Steroidobacteraceae bacterium]|nr:TonB-dependent receptor [Steroidobacteraceae bacterium]